VPVFDPCRPLNEVERDCDDRPITSPETSFATIQSARLPIVCSRFRRHCRSRPRSRSPASDEARARATSEGCRGFAMNFSFGGPSPFFSWSGSTTDAPVRDAAT
jgi:hypothetical protein